ncbi:MAG: HD domain-containing phosphohydrolase, partial [Myxococcota bacterium]|nr:HD domain-containing phosphohydrolase [Myxococcota bacterium]
FVCSQNDTIPFRTESTSLPMNENSLPGFVASRSETLNVADIYQISDGVPYTADLSFDRATGYRTRSMLLVPMNDRDGEVIGVLVLINCKPEPDTPLTNFDRVGSFSERHADVARSIASQAAVAIENYRLYREIRSLFDGFVEAAVTAIEARDPTTGGHSHRVAALTTTLAQACHDNSEGPFREVRFSARELTELHYAAMLHDFGKVGVREAVLLKAEKLYGWEMDQIASRFRLAAMQTMLEGIRAHIETGAITEKLSSLKQDLALIRRLNRPRKPLNEEEVRELIGVAERWSLLELNEPILQPRELERLCIPRGTLDPEERRQIEEHVTHTYQFLKVIPWTRDLRQVPELAYAHHEKLDGTGYPRGLSATEIPFGAKLMTICDIFDAVTASDRPYKPAIDIERAVKILRAEAADGKLASEAVELFCAKRLWKSVLDTD